MCDQVKNDNVSVINQVEVTGNEKDNEDAVEVLNETPIYSNKDKVVSPIENKAETSSALLLDKTEEQSHQERGVTMDNLSGHKGTRDFESDGVDDIIDEKGNSDNDNYVETQTDSVKTSNKVGEKFLQTGTMQTSSDICTPSNLDVHDTVQNNSDVLNGNVNTSRKGSDMEDTKSKCEDPDNISVDGKHKDNIKLDVDNIASFNDNETKRENDASNIADMKNSEIGNGESIMAQVEDKQIENEGPNIVYVNNEIENEGPNILHVNDEMKNEACNMAHIKDKQIENEGPNMAHVEDKEIENKASNTAHVEDNEIENEASNTAHVEDNEIENENNDVENNAPNDGNDDENHVRLKDFDVDDYTEWPFKGVESVDLHVLNRLSRYREDSTSNIENIMENNVDKNDCSNINNTDKCIVTTDNNYEGNVIPIVADFDNISTVHKTNGEVMVSEKKINDKSTTNACTRITTFPKDFAELPEIVLQRIYSYLRLVDLITVQFVCKAWYAAANHSTVWKRWPFKLKKNDSIETLSYRLSFTPYLHRIVGGHSDSESILDVLLKHLVDLRKLNIDFGTPVSSEYMIKLVDKFKTLESVTMNVYNPDILKLLEILETCLNMKELYFSDAYVPENINLQTSEICRKLVDDFPLLQVLDIGHFKLTDSDISYALQNKVKQLTYLSLKCPENTKLDVFKLLVGCRCLKELKLVIPSYSSGMLLDLQEMTCLKKCELDLPSDTPQSMLKYSSFPQGLEKLKIILKELHYRTGLLERIIKSCPELKHLSMTRIYDLDFTEQLKDISSLKKLKFVEFADCKYLKKTGLLFIEKLTRPFLFKLVISSPEGFRNIYE